MRHAGDLDVTGAGSIPEIVAEARAALASVFAPGQRVAVALAPGRVNLIGEHTDYNDGFVLPLAIDRYVAVAFAPIESDMLRAHSTIHGETQEARLESLRVPGRGSWFDYVAGVAWTFREAAVPLRGIEMAVAADLPLKAGLSSSAALELAVARALASVASWPWDPVSAAQLCRRAENEYVGVRCGIMDQLVVACAVEGCALLMDCRSLEATPVPIPREVRVVIMDTGVRRGLAESAYNDRRAACAAAVTALRRVAPVASLCDVDGSLLDRGRGLMDSVTFRRAQHVVAESRRPGDMAAALDAGDLARCSRLMEDSHWSLRDLYDVSCEELDVITDLARTHASCLGARLTGAGFGGSAVALVQADGAEGFVGDVSRAYQARTGLDGGFHLCRPVGAVSIVS